MTIPPASLDAQDSVGGLLWLQPGAHTHPFVAGLRPTTAEPLAFVGRSAIIGRHCL